MELHLGRGIKEVLNGIKMMYGGRTQTHLFRERDVTLWHICCLHPTLTAGCPRTQCQKVAVPIVHCVLCRMYAFETPRLKISL
jgi:hypothetical protein